MLIHPGGSLVGRVKTDAAKYCWLLLAVVPQVADRWVGRRLG